MDLVSIAIAVIVVILVLYAGEAAVRLLHRIKGKPFAK